jgi:hypothetical protein
MPLRRGFANSSDRFDVFEAIGRGEIDRAEHEEKPSPTDQVAYQTIIAAIPTEMISRASPCGPLG